MRRAMDRASKPRHSAGARRRNERAQRAAFWQSLKPEADDHNPKQPEQPAKDSKAFRFLKWMARMGKHGA